jgi:hypothetical protein
MAVKSFDEMLSEVVLWLESFDPFPLTVIKYDITQLVEVLPYKPECRRVRFLIVSLQIFIDINLLAALDPGVECL